MITQLKPADFSAWCERSTTPTHLPVVLDVREPWEWQTASIQKGDFTLLTLAMREVPQQLAHLQASLGQDRPIACLCHHGIRSLQVANYLQQNGFEAVVNLDGGIDAWSQQRDPSVPRY